MVGFNVPDTFYSFKKEHIKAYSSYIKNYNDNLSDLQLRSYKKCKKMV